MSFAYDMAGNRTQITWPDSFYAGYAYDNDNRMITVNENGAVSGVGVLASYTFGSQPTLTGISLGNGASTGLGYDTAFRLNSLAQSCAPLPPRLRRLRLGQHLARPHPDL